MRNQGTSARGGQPSPGEPMSAGSAMRNRGTSARGGGQLVALVSGAQWGAIHFDQLRDCGISKWTVCRWVKAGRLHPRYPAVYAVGHPSLPVEGELTAALLAAGPGATLSHATAAWWWGFIEKEPELIEISVPCRRHTAPAGLRFHHPRRLETARHRRLPVTPPIQTLLDFAAGAPFYEVRRALAEAEYLDRVAVDRVAAALGRGRPGSARLRQALARHQPELARTRNRFEAAFLELCEANGLPVPEFNAPMLGYLVDALWREQRVAVELDGLDGHRTPAQLERDHGRDLVLRQNHFETRRYTWHQVRRMAEEVFADLPSAVRALATRPYQR
jgi:very-short-patch-repair endonuclease